MKKNILLTSAGIRKVYCILSLTGKQSIKLDLYAVLMYRYPVNKCY